MRALHNLSNEELAPLAKAGDAKARELLITRNMGYVYMVANKQAKRLRHLTPEDLAQEGVFGMARAIEKYNPAYGTKFITYADHWIKAAIRRAIRGGNRDRVGLLCIGGEDLVRLPHNVYAKAMKEHTLKRTRSLDTPLPGGHVDGTTFVDVLESDDVATDEVLIRREEHSLVRRALARIIWKDLRLRELIDRRVLSDDPESLASVGEEWGLSRERVRQLEAKAINMLVVAIHAERGPR